MSSINLVEQEDIQLLKRLIIQETISPAAQEAIVLRLIENAQRRLPVKLPTYDQAEEKVIQSPLDLFILSNEPAGFDDETMFRTQLKEAIEWVIKEGYE